MMQPKPLFEDGAILIERTEYTEGKPMVCVTIDGDVTMLTGDLVEAAEKAPELVAVVIERGFHIGFKAGKKSALSNVLKALGIEGKS